ncbi:MAG: dipeptidyl aminopeptidase/acylaminoacyl peptidase [Candidatus Krumholzibacteriia bacterium]|jgi:dipeptidyl aminopeptidase/acylaminoacyl peptidase
MNYRIRSLRSWCFGAVLALLPMAAFAQDDSTDMGYQMPPQVLADIIDAPTTPGVSLSPNNEWLLHLERPGYPSIAEVAQPELRLAGLRINPRSNGPSRGRSLNGLMFQNLESGKEVRVTGLPAEPRITSVTWSADSKHVAFVLNIADQLTLWTTEVKKGEARQVTPEGMALNAVYGRPYSWLSDSKTFIARTIPAGRGEAPIEPAVPSGPVIQENMGKIAPARTLQDLLQNTYDEDLFDYYTTSQLVKLTLKGKATNINEPAVFRSVSSSPDGEYLMVQMVQHPYSYSLKERSFPKNVEIWGLDGDLAYDVAKLPLQDQIPISFGSVAVGRRSFEWRDDKAAQIVWAEALDGGDGGVEAEERERVFTLSAPFKDEPEVLTTLAQRYGGITWGNGELAFVSSWWWTTRNMKMWRIQPDHRDVAAIKWQDRSWQDRYADPGDPVMEANEYGRAVMLTADDGNTIFLDGTGASDEGNRPFLDELNLTTMEATRLFHSEAPYYENPVEIIDVQKRMVLARRESQTEPPNYFMLDLKNDGMEQKTFFTNPTPQMDGISKELITYERSDGVQLSGTLYLPAGYDKEKDGPLPCLMWAYPTEFKSKKDAGQITDSPYRFTRVGWWSPMVYLTRGYAVFDDPTMPIVGEDGEESNDTFIEQLVASAQAAIDVVVERGVVDRDRIAIGGHSYGAFMTGNLLAHSDLFRLGLPRSGAYNRTLTPFGFQAEERTLWEAPKVYFNMSPFMHADKINEPILLVHGAADNNSGTFPMQSERMYGALKGHGATARLVMLPHESHSYRARESLMHLLWETSTWLDRYCKEAPPRSLAATEMNGS